MWNAKGGFFADYLWREGRQSAVLSAATAVPLAFGIATPEQAHAVADTLRRTLLEPGGLGTTLTESGQQWDRPNGWPPLQYLAIEGLNAYGERYLAHDIAERWIETNIQGYALASGVLVEKYDVEHSAGASGGGGRGGEYSLQVGFGWTNGVLAETDGRISGLGDGAETVGPRRSEQEAGVRRLARQRRCWFCPGIASARERNQLVL